jgi:hypothetical protein
VDKRTDVEGIATNNSRHAKTFGATPTKESIPLCKREVKCEREALSIDLILGSSVAPPSVALACLRPAGYRPLIAGIARHQGA